jgi:hypothetical protein
MYQEDDWFDYQLEHDPRFIARMDAARWSLDAGRGITIDQVREQLGLERPNGTKATQKIAKNRRAKARRTT